MIELPEAIPQLVLERACKLQQVPSPTFHEELKAGQVFQHFKALGLEDLLIDEAGNVLARIPGPDHDHPLVFSAHLDTVFPEDFALTLTRSPEQAVGPSIGDNSLGLAGLISIPEMLLGAGLNPRHDIWLAATTCEEGLGDLKGIRAIAERFGPGPTAYISIEGMGLGNILHRGLGVERYRIRASTPGGHSWVDYGAPSAIHVLAGLAARLADLRLPKKPRTTFNIGTIQGGTSINTIASQAAMEVDLRSENPRNLGELSRQVHQAVEATQAKDVRVELEPIGYRPPGGLPTTHPLVQTAERVLRDLGVQTQLDIASTEANLPLSLGYPAITIGLTSGDHAHSTSEYIHIPPITQGLKQILGIIEAIWEGE